MPTITISVCGNVIISCWSTMISKLSRSWALQAGRWHQLPTTSSLHPRVRARGCALWTHSEGRTPPRSETETWPFLIRSDLRADHVILSLVWHLMLEWPLINEPWLMLLTRVSSDVYHTWLTKVNHWNVWFLVWSINCMIVMIVFPCFQPLHSDYDIRQLWRGTILVL